MNLSLSVRIAEGFLSKERALMNLDQLTDLAREAGYDAICMRASQLSIHSSEQDVNRAIQTLHDHQLTVSMVTGNFDIVYNNDRGPDCLRRIDPFLHLARSLGATLVRVAMKTQEDIPWAQQACDQAVSHGIKLVHQCHTLSLFETVSGIEQTLRRVDRPNFGLIFEPANLQLCGQDYGPETVQRLAPWIFNVYLQNQVLKPDGQVRLDTWCRGPVRFDLVGVHEPGSIDFDRVFEGLETIGYDAAITVHQSAPHGKSPAEWARASARFLRERLQRIGR